jgi:hypothetical protein
MKSNEPILSVHLGVRFTEPEFAKIIASRNHEKMNLVRASTYVRYLTLYGLDQANKQNEKEKTKKAKYDKKRTK